MKKWLALLLTTVLVWSSALGGLADSIAPEDADAPAGEVETVPVEDEAAGEAEDVAQLDGDGFILEVEPEVPELTDELLPVPDEAEVVEETEEYEPSAAQPEEDGWAYARVTAGAAVLASPEGDEIAGLRLGDIVLWLAEEGAHARVAFDTYNGVLEGVVRADALEKLAQEEADAFLDALISQGEVALYRNDIAFPLPRLDCLPADTGAQGEDAEPVAEETGSLPEETSGEDQAASPEEAAQPSADAPAESADEQGEEAGLEDGDAAAEAVPEAPDVPEVAAVAAANSAPVAPTKVSLSAASLAIGLGETCGVLKATLLPEGAATTLTWKSSSTRIVSVDKSTGKLRGLKKGSATVTVRTANGKSASCKVTVKAAPTKVTIKPTSVTLTEGKTKQLNKPAVNSGAASGAYRYSSSNTAVATVSSAGKITAKKRGTATVTVKTFNNKSATVKVTVNARPQSVAFTRTSIDMHPGQVVKLGAKAYAADGKVTPAALAFSLADDLDEATEDPGCVSLTEDGELTAQREGRVRLTVTANNDVRSEVDCTVNVLPLAEGIELNETAVTVGVKETYRGLTYSIPEGTATSVTWRSGNKKVAKVDAKTGAVTGVAKGTTTLYARPYGGEEVPCAVTVKAAPRKVVLSPASVRVTDREPVSISASVDTVSNVLTYSYADKASKEIATLDAAAGVVTPLKSGTAKIKVAAYNGVSAVFTLRIDLPVAYIDITNASALSAIAEFQFIAIKAVPVDEFGGYPGATPEYSVENGTGIVSLEGGALRGEETGSAVLCVACEAVQARLEIGVRKGPKMIALKPDRKVIGVGETLKLNPVLTDKRDEVIEDALTVSTNSAGKKVVTCKSGTVSVKGKAPGKATVTVKHANGRSAKVTVTVKKAPFAVKISPASATIGVGQAKTFAAVLPSGSASKCTFKSSNPAVATIDANTGKLRAVAKGETVVTVTTHNKKTAKAKVKVTRAPDYIVLTGSGLRTVTTSNGDGTYTTSYRLTLKKGKTFQINGRVEYPTRGSINGYASSDPSVAKVSSKGLVTALKPGTTDITVTATGGATAVIRLSVWGQGAAPDANLYFREDEITLEVGEVRAAPVLAGTGIPGTELVNALHWSSDESVAIIALDSASKAWNIYGISPGETTITAEAKGSTATLRVHVREAGGDGLGADEGMHFESRSIVMGEGDVMTPALVDDAGAPFVPGTDEAGNPLGIVLSSEDPGVVIAADGSLTAVSSGTSVVTATCGALRAYAQVTVRASSAWVEIPDSALTLFVGDRIALNAASNASPLTYSSDDSTVATVSSQGIVTAVGPGSTTLWAIAGGAMASCAVTVWNQVSTLSLTPASSNNCKVGDALTLTANAGSPDEMGDVTFSVNDESIAQITRSDSRLSGGRATCAVSLKKAGTVLLTVRAANGISATAQITVAETAAPRYRLFTACGYAMPNYTGPSKMPFSLHNVKAVRSIFGGSGMNYSMNANVLNPSRSKLLSALGSYMKAATDNDITVVYLCSHGHYGSTGGTGAKTYYLSFPVATANGIAYEKVTGSDLFAKLNLARGRVLLVLDSCYSGYFISTQKGNLDANGRISVITAATNTRASFYNVPDTNKSMDFFTFFLLMGTGYDGINGWYIKDSKRTKGVAPGYMLADSFENNLQKDGVITLGELYDFTRKSIAANIPNYSTKSWYWGDAQGRQQTYSYFAGDARNLVLYRPKG